MDQRCRCGIIHVVGFLLLYLARTVFTPHLPGSRFDDSLDVVLFLAVGVTPRDGVDLWAHIHCLLFLASEPCPRDINPSFMLVEYLAALSLGCLLQFIVLCLWYHRVVTGCPILRGTSCESPISM
ncbi:hypothetical protein C8R44DRAFT_169587 [Mycena epipterygia]|nr:hypothetical protein C8R44DRAFT_169587 [Mycena epipterygia]